MIHHHWIAAGRSGILAAVLAASLLAACSSDDEGNFACPQIIRVADASRLVKFDGTGRDLTDVRFEIDLQQPIGACQFDDDVIEITLDVAFTATRGPADRERLAPIRYFVAITTLDQQVVAREEFDLNIPFQGNHTRVSVIDQLEPRIPLKPAETGTEYRIYVGISLSPEELRYNRENS